MENELREKIIQSIDTLIDTNVSDNEYILEILESIVQYTNSELYDRERLNTLLWNFMTEMTGLQEHNN